MPYYPQRGSPLLRKLQADLDRTFGGVFLQTPSEASAGDIMALALTGNDRLVDFQVREDDYGGLYYGGESVVPQAHETQYDWLVHRLSSHVSGLLHGGHGSRWAGMYGEGKGTWQDGSQLYGMGSMRRLASQRYFPGFEDPETGENVTLPFSRQNLIEHPEAFQDGSSFYASRDRDHRYGFDAGDMVYQGMVARRNALTGQAEYLNFKADGSEGKFVKHLQVSGFRDVGRLFAYGGGLSPGDELSDVGTQMGLQDASGNLLPRQSTAQDLNILMDPSQPAGYGLNFGGRLGFRRSSTLTQHEWKGSFNGSNFYEGTVEGRYQNIPGLGNTRAWDRVKVFAANILHGNWYDTAQIPITQEVGEGNWGLFSEGSKVFVGRHEAAYSGAPAGQTGVAASPADLFKNTLARWGSIMESVANQRGGLSAIGAPNTLSWDTLDQFKTAAKQLLYDPSFEVTGRNGDQALMFPSATRASRSGAYQWSEARLPLEQAMRLRQSDPETYNELLRQSAPRQSVYGEIIRAGHILNNVTVGSRPTFDASDPNFGLQMAWNEARGNMPAGSADGVSYEAFLGGMDSLFQFTNQPKSAVNRPFSVAYQGDDGATKRLTLPSLRNIRFAMAGELSALGEDEGGDEYSRLRPVYASYGRSALDIMMAIGAGQTPAPSAIEKYTQSLQEMYTSPDTAKRFMSLYPKHGIGAPVGALPGSQDVPLNEMHLGDAQLMQMFGLNDASELDQMKAYLRANPTGANTYRNPNLSDLNNLRLRVMPSDTPDGMLIHKLVQSMSVGDFDPDHAIAYLSGKLKIQREAGQLVITPGAGMKAPSSVEQIMANRVLMDKNMSGLGSAEFDKWLDDAKHYGYDPVTNRTSIDAQRTAMAADIDAIGAGGVINAAGVQGAFAKRQEFKNQMGAAFNFGRALNVLSGGKDEFAQLALPAYQRALDEKAYSNALENFFGVYSKLQPATAAYMKGPVAPGEEPEFVNYSGRGWDTQAAGGRNTAMLHALTSLVGSPEYGNKDFLIDLIATDPRKREQLRGGLARTNAQPEAEREAYLGQEMAFALGPNTWDEAGKLGVIPTALRAAASARWNSDKAPLAGRDILWARFGNALRNTTRFMSGDVTAETMQNMVVPGHMEPAITGLARGSGLPLELDDDSRPEYSNTMDAWAERVGFKLPKYKNPALSASSAGDRNIVAEIMPEEAEMLRGLEAIGRTNPTQARAIYQVLAGAQHGGVAGFQRFDNPALAGATPLAAQAFRNFGGPDPDALWASNWNPPPGTARNFDLANDAYQFMNRRGASPADYSSWAALMGHYGVTFENSGGGWSHSINSGPGAGAAAGGGGAGYGAPPPPAGPADPPDPPSGRRPQRPYTYDNSMTGFGHDQSYARRLLAMQRQEREFGQIDFGTNAEAAMTQLRSFLQTGDFDETALLASLPPGKSGVGEHAAFSSFSRLRGAMQGDGRVTYTGAMTARRNLFTMASRNVSYLDQDSDLARYFTGGDALGDFKDLETDLKGGFAARAAAKSGGRNTVTGSAEQQELVQQASAGLAGVMKQLGPLAEQLENVSKGSAKGAKALKELHEQIEPLDKLKDAYMAVLGRAGQTDKIAADLVGTARANGITDPGTLSAIAGAPGANRRVELEALAQAGKDPRDMTFGERWSEMEDGMRAGKGPIGRLTRGGQVLNGLQWFYLSRMDRAFIDPAIQGAMSGAQDEFTYASMLGASGYGPGTGGGSLGAAGAYMGAQNAFQRQQAMTWSAAVEGGANALSGGMGGVASIAGPSVGGGLIAASLASTFGLGPMGIVGAGALAATGTALTGIASRAQFMANNPEYAAVEQARTNNSLPSWLQGTPLGTQITATISGMGLDVNKGVPWGQQILGVAGRGGLHGEMANMSTAEQMQVMAAMSQDYTRQYGNQDLAQQAILGSQRYFGGGVAGIETSRQFLMSGLDMGQLSNLSRQVTGGGITGSLDYWKAYASNPDLVGRAVGGMGSGYGQAMAQMGLTFSPTEYADIDKMGAQPNAQWGSLAQRANQQEMAYATSGLSVPSLSMRIDNWRRTGNMGAASQRLAERDQQYNTGMAWKDFLLDRGVDYQTAQSGMLGLTNQNSPEANMMAQGLMSGSANAMSAFGNMIGDTSLITRETGTGLPLFTTTMMSGDKMRPDVARMMAATSYDVRSALKGYKDPDGILKTHGGTWGLQAYSMDLSYQATMASAGAAIAGVNRDIAQNMGTGIGGYSNIYAGQALPWSTDGAVGQPFTEGRGLWAVEDDSTKLSRTQRREQMGMAQANRDLQLRQYNENWDFNRMYAGVQYGNQQEDFAMRGQQMRMQRNWQQEDWSYDRNQRSMQFGWKMEDYDDNLRYSTGRDRRILERDKGRATTMHNMEEGRSDTMESRQREAWKMEDTRFETEKKRAKELYDLSMQRADMEKRHFLERMAQDDQARDKQRQWMIESEKLDDERIQIQRSFWKENAEAQKAQAGAQAAFAGKQHEINKVQLAISQLAEETGAKLRLKQETEVTFYTNMAIWFEKMVYWVANGAAGAPPAVPPAGGWNAGSSGGGGGGNGSPVGQGPNREFSGPANFMSSGASGGSTEAGVHIYLDGKEIAFHIEEEMGKANGKRIVMGRKRN